MTTDDSRGARDGGTSPPSPTDDVYEDEISLGPLIRTLWSYRRVTVVSVSGIFAMFLLWGLGTYLFQPAERQASLEFRLIFDGANQSRYPNGLIFSRAEIIGSPVLSEVFEDNDLESYYTYDEFKNGLFILEASSEVELLGFEYQAKLTDTRLTSVDRVALEEEFRQKREALRASQYALSFVVSSSATSIPPELMSKVLNDILGVWAEQAATRKGVLTYGVSVYTRNLLLEEFLEAEDFIVRVDILRGQVNRVVANLGDLELLPGANVMRVGENRISLPEIRVNLEDLITYRLEPLAQYIWANGLSRDSEVVGLYLQGRQFQIALDLQEADGRGNVLEDSLRVYVEQAGTPAPGSGVGDGGGSATGAPVAGVTALIPQIGDSFLDRIMAMGGETEDIQYRQELTNRIIDARQQAVNLQREAAYYERMHESMQRALNEGGEVPNVDVVREVETRFTEIYAAVVEALEQSEAIYTEVSAQNLNPQTNLFRITSPFSSTTLHAVTLQTLGLTGLWVLTLSFMVVPLACLMHYHFRRQILPARSGRQPDVPQQEEPKARVETVVGS